MVMMITDGRGAELEQAPLEPSHATVGVPTRLWASTSVETGMAEPFAQRSRNNCRSTRPLSL
jgi:hypothetical protein